MSENQEIFPGAKVQIKITAPLFGDPRLATKKADRYRFLLLADTFLREAEMEMTYLLRIIDQVDTVDRAVEKKAMWCSAFMNYSRCFSSGITNFHNELAGNYSQDEIKVHEWVIETRNTFFGHTDSNPYSDVTLTIVLDARARRNSNKWARNSMGNSKT